jgi:hypothetical protein
MEGRDGWMEMVGEGNGWRDRRMEKEVDEEKMKKVMDRERDRQRKRD